MKKDYAEDYTQLLERTLELINQKQAYMQKLINGQEGFERDNDISSINKLTELIEGNRRRLEELKKLRQEQ